MDRQAVVVRNALVRHNRRSATTLCVLNATLRLARTGQTLTSKRGRGMMEGRTN